MKRLIEVRLIERIDRSDRLSKHYAGAAAGVELDTCMGIDWRARPFASGAGPLHGPANLSCIHRSDGAGLPCFENVARAGQVGRTWVFQNGHVTTVGLNHFEKDSEC